MALKPLDPAPTEALGNGWELVAPEAGRSNQGLRATVTLFSGVVAPCRVAPDRAVSGPGGLRRARERQK